MPIIYNMFGNLKQHVDLYIGFTIWGLTADNIHNNEMFTDASNFIQEVINVFKAALLGETKIAH